MEHLESVQEAKFYVEQMKKELQVESLAMDDNAAVDLDPMGVQEDGDCEEESMNLYVCASFHDGSNYCCVEGVFLLTTTMSSM